MSRCHVFRNWAIGKNAPARTKAHATYHVISVPGVVQLSVFPNLGPPDREWLGFRPSMPDSLPVIGYSKGGPEIIHAFGHGHIGVTLAPITGRIVADLIAGREPEVDIRAYSAGRF